MSDSLSTSLADQISQFRAFLYFHGYQPPRKLVIDGQVIFDISGEDKMTGGYNERVWDRCYNPLTIPIEQEGVAGTEAILSSNLVAEHLFGVTRDWIKVHHEHAWEYVRQVFQDTPIPFVDPYLHPILPLLPDQAQVLMIDIGIKAWELDMERQLIDDRRQPLLGFGFWPPELAVNQRTLELLAFRGVKFLVLDQAQIKTDQFSPIYEIATKNGPIYVFAYNGKEFAQQLAFANIDNAETFGNKVKAYVQNHQLPPLAAMDMETFGEWRGMDSIFFLNYLVHTALNPEDFKRSAEMIQPAQLVEPSSWSCQCGFGRWDGSAACAGESHELQQLKQDLYTNLRSKLDQTLTHLNQNHSGWDETFVNFFVNGRERLGAGQQIEFLALSNELQAPFKRLYVNLVGMTSCGWFYTDSEIERAMPKGCLGWLEAH